MNEPKNCNWKISNPPNSDRYFIVDELGHIICEMNYGDREENANIIIQSIIAHKKIIDLSKILKDLLNEVMRFDMHHEDIRRFNHRLENISEVLLS